MRMEDIARLAGVSKAAVSLAFNDRPGISPETKEKIMRIAKENRYVPKQRQTASTEAAVKRIAFLVITNSGIVLQQYYQQPFFRELIGFIEERCRAKGYSLMFSAVDIAAFESNVRSVTDETGADGIILLGTNLTAEHIASIAGLVPKLVVLDTCFDALPVHFVEINNFMGGYQAGAYLIEQGHSRIGYIASNVRIHNFMERERGFTAALRQRGLEVDERHRFSVAPTILTSQESLRRQLESFLSSGGDLPSALYCECDYIAISALKTLSELGFRVPEHISIVGFDNIDESVVVTPELTTIHVEKERMAQIAVDLLSDGTANAGQEIKTKIKVDTRLVERGSVVMNQEF